MTPSRTEPRWVRRTARAVAVTLLAVAAVQGWALLSLDRSTVARALVWRDADVEDWQRFPALPIAAGDEVLELTPGALPVGTLQRVAVPGSGEEALDDLLRRTGTTSLLVLRDAEILLETYPADGDPAGVRTSFSVAKSVLSTLVGIALERGELRSLDDPVTDYLPELLDRDPRFERITLRHLVTMSSGLAYTEHGTPWSQDTSTYYAPDLRALALTVEIDEEPGQAWHYNNFNPLLVGLVLERATGEPVAEYASKVLWQPMGAQTDASWSADSQEHRFPKMESGVNAVARDWARFGYLFAHQGRVGDRQVVPAEWVAEATRADTSADPAAHYQYWWWVDTERPGRFYARGNKGQFVYVAPDSGVVVVRTGRDYGIDGWPEVLRDVADRVEAAG